MEKALIRIRQEQVGENTEAVIARELHSHIAPARDFSTWIRGRIKDCGYCEGTDYEVFNIFVENPQGGRPAVEYLISLDMAKELCMLERNEKGRQARRYFIECEKKLRQLAQDMAELERQAGARAMAALMARLDRTGRKYDFLSRLIAYRRMGLSQRETGKLLEVDRETIRSYEYLLKDCGYDIPSTDPSAIKKRWSAGLEVLPC